MGCSSSKDVAKEYKVSGQRRRLSIAFVEGNKDGSKREVIDTEEERGMIREYGKQEIYDMLEETQQGRSMSIGSGHEEKRAEFSKLKIQDKAKGADLDVAKEGLGYACKKGKKPESPNQDAWSILKVDKFSMYAVYDGAGDEGHHVSIYARDNLPKIMMRDQRFNTDKLPDLLKDSFKKLHSLIASMTSTVGSSKKFNATVSGTTASMVIRDHEANKLTVANVANSRAVLGSWDDSGDKKAVKAEDLTKDHKPDDPEEKQRIEKNGGLVFFDGVANCRVYGKGQGRVPGLNKSRFLGHLQGHKDAGLTAEPHVIEHQIQPTDRVLLLCSDGVWQMISSKEAVDFVSEFKPSTSEAVDKAMQAAEALAKKAWDRWIEEENGDIVDDITVILVYLNSTVRSGKDAEGNATGNATLKA